MSYLQTQQPSIPQYPMESIGPSSSSSSSSSSSTSSSRATNAPQNPNNSQVAIDMTLDSSDDDDDEDAPLPNKKLKTSNGGAHSMSTTASTSQSNAPPLPSSYYTSSSNNPPPQLADHYLPLWSSDASSLYTWLLSIKIASKTDSTLIKDGKQPYSYSPPPPSKNSHSSSSSSSSSFYGTMMAAPELTQKILQVESTLTDQSIAEIISNAFASADSNSFQVLDPSISHGLGVTLVPGSLLSQASLSLLINAILCIPGGACDISDSSLRWFLPSTAQAQPRPGGGTMLPAVAVIPHRIQCMAKLLRRAIAARLEQDQLFTTPLRIIAMLCPESSQLEVMSIRARVYDTVVLGQGTHSSAAAEALEESDEPIIAKTSKYNQVGDVNDLDNLSKCTSCAQITVNLWERSLNDYSKMLIFTKEEAYWKGIKNRVKDYTRAKWKEWAVQRPDWFNAEFIASVPDEFIPEPFLGRLGGAGRAHNTADQKILEINTFTVDRRNGDVICTECGFVAKESLMHEGTQYRTFEGELDRNHHGDAANSLFSTSYNMGTALSGMQMTSAAGVGGWGSGRNNLETMLKNAHSYTEMNISQFGKKEKKTRIGYKDKQKREAFYQMKHVGESLNLHDSVVARAKELFAGYRDDREIVQSFKAVIAGCMWEAFDQMRKDGKSLRITASSVNEDEEMRMNMLGGRKAKRDEMHVSSIATSTNDMTSVKIRAEEEGGEAALGLINKPVSSWDLDDVRLWLLDASRTIAKHQHENSALAVLEGNKDDIEGQLVDKVFLLCEKLEEEAGVGDSSITSSSMSVKTSRLADMGSLGIKWQGGNERGSGGAGGVGNSGRNVMGVKAGEKKQRSPGQLLMIKSAKKFGDMVEDDKIGALFNKALKTMVEAQNALKKKKESDKNAELRFKQSIRKPWLSNQKKV